MSGAFNGVARIGYSQHVITRVCSGNHDKIVRPFSGLPRDLDIFALARGRKHRKSWWSRETNLVDGGGVDREIGKNALQGGGNNERDGKECGEHLKDF